MKSPSERDQTDKGLREERTNLDRDEAARRTRVEQTADSLIERAREKADAIVGTARGKADSKTNISDREAVTRERALEDQTLHGERAQADELLRLEREEQTLALAALLPLERVATDRLLLIERVRSDAKLANRDDFLGMVSHDLRNLLAGIVTSASVLAEEASNSDEGRRTVEGTARIQRYAARMNRLVGDLVDVVSIDAGKLAVQLRHGDAAHLMSEAVDAFAQAASQKGITLTCGKHDALEANFDPERMLQVLANLITNALKFTPAGGQIAIQAAREPGQLHLSVTDTGHGIPPQMLEAVFERFWQVGKNDQRGLGLGLYISKCIVLAHGGRIWAESTVGQGSVFHFTIPVA